MPRSESSRASAKVAVRRVGAQQSDEDTDLVAVEEPLEIRLGEQSLSITMRTPGDDLNLATGFLFTEGIISDMTQIDRVDHAASENTEEANENVVVVGLADGVSIDMERLQRNFYTTSSCGVCGKSSIEALTAQAHYAVKGDKLRLQPDVLSGLPDVLMRHQQTFSDTGGLHAAGLFDANGDFLDVREDVGRHNAVDKLIGHALRQGRLPLWDKGILVSGRVSFEIMQKVRMAGCPFVAAVGAPSSMAVDMAWEFDMTLVGFLRDGRFNVYATPARVA